MASQPVAVHIPVGPPRAEELIYLPANEPLVLAYPCLPWVQHVAAGGAQQQASLSQFVAIRVFLLRNAIGTGPNDLAIARTRTPLTISFSAGAWSRWLTVLRNWLRAASWRMRRTHDFVTPTPCCWR